MLEVEQKIYGEILGNKCLCNFIGNYLLSLFLGLLLFQS